ncbi:hypothetical protein O0L34_g11620 [Tuta absoluta]|nr:hypothetical protein O0L34_g11620 [Tuta absoluta]
MSTDQNDAQKLPDGWILCQSKSNPGRKYYFNKKTGKSSWTQPQADEKTCKAELCKQKGKKEKKTIQEKRKEEMQKKNLKRKSSGSESSPSKKRQKPVSESSPENPNHGLIKIPSPLKQKVESPQKNHAEQVFIPESPVKSVPSVPSTPCKNIANNRLSNLREQLNAEVQSLKQGEAERSPQKRNLRISPKATQTETQAKTPRDLKSPHLNESKCSTSQSPSSDSVPSIPSPSQFFAANKIICSMKAQLPEEYSSKVKPIDTFAAIEEGICNQITEYPYMKHPATPPQFSEASKLLSAIKSKLSGRVSCKDLNLKTFTSAKERMENLRSRLSNDVEKVEVCKEITDEEYLSRIELPPTEDMDVEECKEIKQNVPSFQCTKDNVGSKENIVLVVDTNIFIHELDVIKNVLNSHIKGYSEQPDLLVPWRVVNELDRLKDNNNGNGAICKRARSAMDYLYKSLPENNRIKGQSLRDANSHIYPCESPDDEILNCCLQQAERGKSVVSSVLLSTLTNIQNHKAEHANLNNYFNTKRTSITH